VSCRRIEWPRLWMDAWQDSKNGMAGVCPARAMGRALPVERNKEGNDDRH
jgi:hypothetical protein